MRIDRSYRAAAIAALAAAVVLSTATAPAAAASRDHIGEDDRHGRVNKPDVD